MVGWKIIFEPLHEQRFALGGAYPTCKKTCKCEKW
jgi:hypothetical protein